MVYVQTKLPLYIYIEESKTIINKYFNKRETIKNIKKF